MSRVYELQRYLFFFLISGQRAGRREQGGIFYIALNSVWYNFAFIARESELFRNLSEAALDVVNGYIYARKNFIAFKRIATFFWSSGLHALRVLSKKKFAIFNPDRDCSEIFRTSFCSPEPSGSIAYSREIKIHLGSRKNNRYISQDIKIPSFFAVRYLAEKFPSAS